MRKSWPYVAAALEMTREEFLAECGAAWDMAAEARKRLVRPVSCERSPLKWLGGKRKLASLIISLMPEHVCYCEVFGGGAHVLFGKEPSPVEVLNDINGELVNFWRCVREGLDFFEVMYETAVYSREEFMAWRDANPHLLDREQRAWRFWLLNRMSFGARGGVGERGSFGTTTIKGGQAMPFMRGLPLLANAHKRLENVIVENLCWEDCIGQYDGLETFFYLDPPYYGFEDDYGPGVFSRCDFDSMANCLLTLKGKFLLSINDCPEAREIFRAFDILSGVDITYNVDATRPKAAGELLIGNFSPPRVDKQLPLM